MEGCYFKFVSLLEVCVLRQILVFKVNTFLLNQNIPDNHRICQVDWFLYDRTSIMKKVIKLKRPIKNVSS